MALLVWMNLFWMERSTCDIRGGIKRFLHHIVVSLYLAPTPPFHDMEKSFDDEVGWLRNAIRPPNPLID